MSLVGMARARPDQVRKVLDSVLAAGPDDHVQEGDERLDSYTPLGYSLCGVVTEVGRGASEFHVGQMVAAAGNEYVLHAEYNCSRGLRARVPGADGPGRRVLPHRPPA